MASAELRIINRRIKSVKSTKKITRAMELIASSRIVKAQQRMESSNSYIEVLDEIVQELEQKELDDYTNPSDYEDKTERFKNYDESADLKEVTTDEEQFRAWDGVDDDWEEFNSKDDKKKSS